MAIQNGTLGGAALERNKWAAVYAPQAPAIAATCTVSFCNKGAQPARVALAIGPGPDETAPGTIYLEFNATVKVGTPLERTGIPISTGRKLFVKSDLDNIDVYVGGYEKLQPTI